MGQMPLNRTAPGISYGWWNVLASFAGLALSYAMFTVFSFGVFVAPLEAEFGWSRAEISVALTLTNITVVICSPLVGALADRIGVRRVVIPSVILMGLAVGSMCLLQGRILHLYLMYVLIPLVGAGTLPLTYSRIVVTWFVRRRGLALGISLAGFGVGATLMPIVGQWLIEHYGWREAYVAFAALIFLVNLPLALLLRESPQARRMRAAGPQARSRDRRQDAVPMGLSAHEARRTRSFWYVFFSFLLVGFGVTGILAHLVPMLVGRGISPGTASLFMGSLGAGLIVGRILAGHLMDYFFAPRVTACFLAAMLAGIVVLALGLDGPVIWVAVVLIGLALGSEISEIAYIVSRYFGSRAFGQIYGTMFAAFQIGAAFGAPALGLYYDGHGNYTGALWVLAGMVLMGIFLILALGPYPDLGRERPA